MTKQPVPSNLVLPMVDNDRESSLPFASSPFPLSSSPMSFPSSPASFPASPIPFPASPIPFPASPIPFPASPVALSSRIRLPAECLTRIFRYARDRFLGRWERRSKTIIFLSWVCSAWRYIILNDASLWAFIDVESPRWIQEFLVRSIRQPLSVSLYDVRQDATVLAPLIIPHLHRVKSLIFSPPLNQNVIVNLGSSIWTTAAPVLTSVDLSYFSVPENTFEEGDTQLEHLSLDRCEFSWTSYLLGPSLSSLSIRDPHNPVTLAGLCNLLLDLPRLESLGLVHVVATGASRVHAEQWRTMVPRLRLRDLERIQIVEKHSCILEAICSFLDLSNVSDITFETEESHHYSRLVLVILACANKFDIQFLSLTAHPDSTHIILKTEKHLRTLTISWNCANFQHVISGIFRYLGLYGLQYLQLDYIGHNQFSIWLRWHSLVESLPYLDEIELANGAAVDFFNLIPLGHTSDNPVKLWVFRVEPELYGQEERPIRSQTRVTKLLDMTAGRLRRQVLFEGGWWDLGQEEISRLESGRWDVVLA